MAERHKHADLIIAWANGARIEMREASGRWVSVTPSWDTDVDYRVKPRMIKIGGFEVPAPMREASELESIFYLVDTSVLALYRTETWDHLSIDEMWFQRGLCHSTKEAAITHAKALIAVSGGTV